MNNIDLLGIIKNEMTRSRKPAARRLPTFYPSEASAVTPDGETLGGCSRKTWYRTNRVPPSNTSEFYLKMIHTLGSHIEDVVVEQMKRAGIFEANSVKFYNPEYNLSGEIDIAGRYRRQDGSIGYYGVEVKSVYGMGATQTITGRRRAWRGQPAFRPKPKESNLMQTMIYIREFSSKTDSDTFLEYFKLLYLPRDKPVDGREYTVRLMYPSEFPSQFSDLAGTLNQKHQYAFITTPDHPDYIEDRFSIDDIYERFKLLKDTLASGGVPDRTFEKYYSKEKVTHLHEIGKISDNAYQDFKKGRKTPGHFLCQSYCEYRDHCYERSGRPRKEADSLTQIVVSSKHLDEAEKFTLEQG